jgi:hypothetical protein
MKKATNVKMGIGGRFCKDWRPTAEIAAVSGRGPFR